MFDYGSIRFVFLKQLNNHNFLNKILHPIDFKNLSGVNKRIQFYFLVGFSITRCEGLDKPFINPS